MAVGQLTAERVNRIKPAQTIAISSKARAMRSAGRRILQLSSGEPDFDTPPNIKAAAKAAIDAGKTKYTDTGGVPELRDAVAQNFSRVGLTYKRDEVMIASGAKQVIFNALLATVEAGDEVVIPTPCWVSYPDIVALADGVARFVPCSVENGFRMTAADLEAAISPRTKWVVLNNPCNPTGAAYTAEQLTPLCAVLRRHPHVWIMADDIYDQLVYDNIKSGSVASVDPSLLDRTLTINGCSKTYAMTGWRIGYAGGPRKLISVLEKLQSQSTSNPSSIGQAAALEAITGPQDFIQDMVRTYQKRRDIVVSMLNDAAGLQCPVPEGAFYVFPAMRDCIGLKTTKGVTINGGETFVAELLEEEGVAVVHGTAFMCEGHFRISYAASTEVLTEACHRIQSFCSRLKS